MQKNANITAQIIENRKTLDLQKIKCFTVTLSHLEIWAIKATCFKMPPLEI